MKIVYVVTVLALGGAETQVVRLAVNMRTKGHDVSVISLMDPDYQPFLDTLKENDIACRSLHMLRGKASIKSFYTYLRYIREINPDIIHANMIHANLLARAGKILDRKKPLINTIHGEEEFLGKRALVYRATDFGADAFVCVGKVLEEQARSKKVASAAKIHTIYNGLDTEKFIFSDKNRREIRQELAIPQEAFTWITVGRHSPVKNYGYLLKEFYITIQKGLDAYLIFVGEGEQTNQLKKFSVENGLQDRIRFLGKRTDVDKILSAADAFVLSSIHEGLPLCLQEAASVGLPVIATDVGGSREVVVSGKNGFIVNTEKGEVLSEYMERLIMLDEDVLEQWKLYSRNLACRTFDLEQVAVNWINMYDKLAKSK